MPRPPKPRVLVALSGGVDSSVAAALLLEQGYDVVAATMRVLSAAQVEGSPSEEARRVSEHLGIPHETLDLSAPFERDIVTHFAQEYAAGRTPNPCIRCNRLIKFGAFLKKATQFGAAYLATGHYVRVEHRHGRHALRRGVDRPKDQSYVLAALTQEQLANALFPLGGFTKAQVRARARALALPAADAEESQEACFIPEGRYGDFLAERLGPPEPGPILSTRGDLLGQHKGLIHYTIGQRRGLGISDPRPYYVTALDPARNAIIVGHDEETLCGALTAGHVNWVGMPPQADPFECRVQIRYLHQAVPATVTPVGNRIKVHFHEPQRAVAPGQWAVLYDDDGYLLAGGIIET